MQLKDSTKNKCMSRITSLTCMDMLGVKVNQIDVLAAEFIALMMEAVRTSERRLTSKPCLTEERY
jgi:hydroxymethylpyrimidine/phosphomethylpyrimidine kinase